MQTTKKVIPLESFDKEFNELMQNYSIPQYFSPEPQWKSPSDFFVKFSLYPERSCSVASTNTSFPNHSK